MPHALSCPKGGLVLEQHNNAAKEWGALSARDLNPSFISCEPKINSRTVQGESNRAGARVSALEQEGEGNKDGEGATGQAMVPGESRADVSVHGLWKWVTSTLFDMRIVNLDAGSYLRQISINDLETAEKEKKVQVPPALFGK